MSQFSASEVERHIGQFLAARVNDDVPVDRDLFASGLVSSMFAMELVVFLEQAFALEILGEDLKRDNFRTIRSMTDLVLRLQPAETHAEA
ncbi:acyl carrier protein [Jidongwangia harbinensis]|uniref:acyl carrier protein n=1 Tax=Jidongwangia harbinensis TaxID=2878561 RepID=UPI001CD9FC2F|nr:acyl carrier protein [Jidongwangia harbinensis]MCA2217198.1 acyl carrier protein [Jidongwangia harbinensis]